MTEQLFGQVLAQPGWIQFVTRWQELTHEPIRVEDDKVGTAVTIHAYRSRQGRFVAPHLSTYAPICFASDPTVEPRKLERSWLRLTERIGAALLEGGLKRPITLPPGVQDVRGLQQAGFRLENRFTSIITFPWSVDDAVPNVLKRARRAAAAGLRGCRDLDDAELMTCVQATATRKGFDIGLSLDALRLGSELLGEEGLRFYGARAPGGEVACARAVLCSPDGYALEWLAGTDEAYMSSGATQLMMKFMIEDLSAQRFAAFDLAGANIPSVAQAKRDWGGELVPFSAVFPRGARDLAVQAKQSIASWRRRRSSAEVRR